MTAGHSDKSGQHEISHAPEHSQTLPMITDQIAASHPTTASESTSDGTTPVLPPNPIRTTVQPVREPAVTARESAVTASTAAAVGESVQVAEDEKKSEGRISATQLIAGAGAAATSSVIGGQLGVAGTVVGAGVASIVTALAVTVYGHSLDKGKEKIQQVGSKLAPAVKAKIAKNPAAGNAAAVDPSLAVETAFAPPEPVDANQTAASVRGGGSGADDEESLTATAHGRPRSWMQKLRRKRVLYPLTIGVAVFGIGLGGVVLAESFTDADLSPGTSQISRSVSGESTAPEDTGTNSGSSDSGSSGDGSAGGSGANGGQNSADSTGRGTNDRSTSVGETDSQGAESGRTDEETSTSAGTGTETGSTTADGTDTDGSTAGAGSGTGTDGGADGSSGGGRSGSGGASGGSSGAGTDGSGSGSDGGQAGSAQG